MGFTGDFAAMRHLADRIGDLAQVPSRASKAVAERLNDLVADEYASGSDPYGEPWAPLMDATLDKGRSPPPLTASGDMAGGTLARPMRGKGVAFTVPDPGGFHQGGTVNMEAREILPAGEELPPPWSKAIEEEVRAAFGGRGAR